MTAPNHIEIVGPGSSTGRASLQKPPLTVGEFSDQTPQEKWPKVRAFRIESAEENEYANLLSEMNWVMKHCQVKILGRVDRREIKVVEMDKANARLNDALHGVRRSLQALFHLAGFQDYRFREEETPRREPGKPESASPAPAPAPGGAVQSQLRRSEATRTGLRHWAWAEAEALGSLKVGTLHPSGGWRGERT
jgi:hypothetical protein